LEEVVAYIKKDLTLWENQAVKLYVCPILGCRNGVYEIHAFKEFMNVLPHVTCQIGEFKPFGYDSRGNPTGMNMVCSVDEDAPVDFTKQHPAEIAKYCRTSGDQASIKVDVDTSTFSWMYRIPPNFVFNLGEVGKGLFILRDRDEHYPVNYGPNSFPVNVTF
jgi:hypothetical protein